MKFDFDKYGSAFLAMRLHRLRLVITAQSDVLLEQLDIRVPSSCVSVVLFLKERKAASISQIAAGTDYSHQLISQRLAQLEKLKLINRDSNELDGRKLLIRLTKKGENQAVQLEKMIEVSAEIMNGIYSEIDCDLDEVLDNATSLLKNKPMAERARLMTDVGQ